MTRSERNMALSPDSPSTALRVGVDVASLSDRALTGIPLYVESLLRIYLADPAPSESWVLTGSQWGTDLPALLRERGIVLQAPTNVAIVPEAEVRIGPRHPGFARKPGVDWLVRKLDGRVLLPLNARETGKRLGRVDVFHYTAFLRIPPERAQRTIVTIYDLTTRFFPEQHNRVNIAEWERVYAYAKAKADLVITDSESARQDVIEHLGVAPDRVRSIPLGVRPLPRVLPQEAEATLQKFTLAGGRFLLAAGSLDPRKNLPRLIEAFAALRRDPAFADVRLAITGARLHGTNGVEDAIKQHAMTEAVVLTGYASDAELAALMQQCDGFVYPSLYEGFGLPVIEAMALGAPVATSNLSSLPEVAGDAALLFDPHSTDAIREALETLLTDTPRAQELRARGVARAALFTWEKCAEEHRQAYRDVSGR